MQLMYDARTDRYAIVITKAEVMNDTRWVGIINDYEEVWQKHRGSGARFPCLPTKPNRDKSQGENAVTD